MPSEKFKVKIHTQLLDVVRSKVETLMAEYRLYRESSEGETKSSAGDKHETGKALMQLEQEKLESQLKKLKEFDRILSGMNPEQEMREIGFGSLVETNYGYFYISIPEREIDVDGMKVYFVSLASPLVKAMQNSGKKSFDFNGRNYEVLAVI